MKALHSFTDKVLVDRAQAGDLSAYEVIFKRYSGKVYRFIFFRIKDSASVDDLVNEVFLKLWQQLQKGVSIKNVRAYIYQMARNSVIDHYRTRREHVDITKIEHVLESEYDMVAENMTQSEIRELLKRMSNLRDDYQEMLHLRYVEDFTITEIAEILKKSKGAVKVTIHRAVKKLQDLYDQE